MKALKINVSGKVQGVYFRSQCSAKAKELLINGWVKNMPDGSVQIVAEGETEALIQFVNWCHRGPLFAKVDYVKTEETDWQGFKEFLISK